MKPFIHCLHETGMAVWLLVLYWHNASPSSRGSWTVVAQGKPLRDSETARALSVCVRTATRWRRRLEDCNLIKTEVCHGGFKVWLRNLDRPEDTETQRTGQWPAMQTDLVQ
jgi:hypothetical protein